MQESSPGVLDFLEIEYHPVPQVLWDDLACVFTTEPMLVHASTENSDTLSYEATYDPANSLSEQSH